MKKIFIFLSIVLLIGCSNDLNEKLVENIKVLETNDLLLSNILINYDTYKENTKGILKDYSHKRGEIIFNIGGKDYSAIDLEFTSKEKLNTYREDVIEIFKDKINPFTKDVEIKISNTYDAGYNEWKYVFTKVIKKYETDDNSIGITNKRYTLEKINGKWKVINIDKFTDFFYDNMENKKGRTKKEAMKSMKYQTINNEKVEYIISFNPLD